MRQACRRLSPRPTWNARTCCARLRREGGGDNGHLLLGSASGASDASEADLIKGTPETTTTTILLCRTKRPDALTLQPVRCHCWAVVELRQLRQLTV